LGWYLYSDAIPCSRISSGDDNFQPCADLWCLVRVVVHEFFDGSTQMISLVNVVLMSNIANVLVPVRPHRADSIGWWLWDSQSLTDRVLPVGRLSSGTYMSKASTTVRSPRVGVDEKKNRSPMASSFPGTREPALGCNIIMKDAYVAIDRL